MNSYSAKPSQTQLAGSSRQHSPEFFSSHCELSMKCQQICTVEWHFIINKNIHLKVESEHTSFNRNPLSIPIPYPNPNYLQTGSCSNNNQYPLCPLSLSHFEFYQTWQGYPFSTTFHFDLILLTSSKILYRRLIISD